MQRHDPDAQRDCWLERHEGSEGRLGEPAERVQLEGPRNEWQEDRGAQRDQQNLRRQVSPRLRQPDSRRHHRGDGQRNRQPIDSRESVAHVLGDHDVEAPPHTCERGEGDSGEVRRSAPRFGEQHDAHQGECRPREGTTASAVNSRHGERSKELDGHHRAQRKQVDGG